MENFANLRLCYFFMLWQSMWQWHIFNGKLETTKMCLVKLASSVFWQNTSGFIDLFWRQLASVFFQVGNIIYMVVVIKKKKRHTFLPHIKLKIVEVGLFSSPPSPKRIKPIRATTYGFPSLNLNEFIGVLRSRGANVSKKYHSLKFFEANEIRRAACSSSWSSSSPLCVWSQRRQANILNFRWLQQKDDLSENCHFKMFFCLATSSEQEQQDSCQIIAKWHWLESAPSLLRLAEWLLISSVFFKFWDFNWIDKLCRSNFSRDNIKHRFQTSWTVKETYHVYALPIFLKGTHLFS